MKNEQITKTADIIANLSEFLDKNEITFAVEGRGVAELNGREADKWLACFTSKRGRCGFDYHTGIGLRKAYKYGRYKAVPPPPVDVLWSLVFDFFSLYSVYGFVDWAETMGFNPDSIKDRDIYDACCENATKLVKVFTLTQMLKLQEILQDY